MATLLIVLRFGQRRRRVSRERVLTHVAELRSAGLSQRESLAEQHIDVYQTLART